MSADCISAKRRAKLNLFREKIREKIADNNLQIALDGNVERRLAGRALAIASVPDWEARRQKAHAIRAEVIEHLDSYLAQFVGNVQKNGITVHRAAEIVSSLEEAIRLPEVAAAPATVLVTGPSRTADIEMTLTIGVHGPGEVHVFLVEISS